jgi:hypothetical protein
MRPSKRKTVFKKSHREKQTYIGNPEFLGCNFSQLELEKCVRLNDLEIDILIVKYYFFN